MALVFNPMSCEEPHKPTYEYTPIPKVVDCEEEDCGCDCGCSESSESTSQSASTSESVQESTNESVTESIVASDSESSSESESVTESISESESQTSSESESEKPVEPKQSTFDEIKDKLTGLAVREHYYDLVFTERVVDGISYYIDLETGYVYDKTGQDLALKNSGYSPDNAIGKLYINGQTISLNPLDTMPTDIEEHFDGFIDY